jgi:hypothetical protein
MPLVVLCTILFPVLLSDQASGVLSRPARRVVRQADVEFNLAGISNEKTKFYHVISHLDHQYAAEVDIVTSAQQKDSYTRLKTELLNRLSSKEQPFTCSSRSRWATVSRSSS